MNYLQFNYLTFEVLLQPANEKAVQVSKCIKTWPSNLYEAQQEYTERNHSSVVWGNISTIHPIRKKTEGSNWQCELSTGWHFKKHISGDAGRKWLLIPLFHWSKTCVNPLRSGFCVQWDTTHSPFPPGSVEPAVDSGFSHLASARLLT